MIAKAHRFHGFSSLKAVYGRGQTVRGPVLAVKSMLNPRRRTYRAAVVVSRKVHKSAVVRNRIRRRVYEIIRSLEGRISHPYDIVITIYTDTVETMPHADLVSNVTGQLKRAGVLGAAGSAARGPVSAGHAIVEPMEKPEY